MNAQPGQKRKQLIYPPRLLSFTLPLSSTPSPLVVLHQTPVDDGEVTPISRTLSIAISSDDPESSNLRPGRVHFRHV